MNKDIKVPFDLFGNHQTYLANMELAKDNFNFSGKLKYVTYERGRSALNIVWEDLETKIQYRSGMKLLDEVLSGKTGFTSNNFTLVISGSFSFKKQGTSVLLIKNKEL